MPRIATSVSPYRSANLSTILTFVLYCDTGCSQKVFYHDYAIFHLFMRIYSVWIYRVQGETKGDFRRGDKRYAIRILERVRLELFG